jgi:hypothetical protein
MAQISNLNVQIDQNQVNRNRIGTGTVEPPHGTRAGETSGIRSGTLVEGQVLSRNDDGNYTVRIGAQGGTQIHTLTARATLELIVGEHFRAVWDASEAGGIPILRLSQGELSFLTRLPAADRELATALLSRGMPLSDEVLLSIREAWRRMGGGADQLAPLLELWARDLPLTPENAQILAWYMALSGEEANAVWARIRKELKDRLIGGENPIDVLRALRENGGEGDAEIAKFLRGHSLLLRASREEVNPALLSAPLWPVPEEMPDIVARVFVGRVREQGNRAYWQTGFTVEGSRLGMIGGDIESDGRSCNLNFYAEQSATCELLKHKRHAIRRELETLSLVLQFISVSRYLPEGLRRQILAGRGLDVTV